MITAVIYLCVVLTLFVIGYIIEKRIIPHLNPENKFRKWWRNNIIDEDPYHK